MKNSIDQIFRAWNLFMRKPTGSFLIVNIDVIKTTVICFPFINPLSLPLASLLFSLLFTPFVYSSPFFFFFYTSPPFNLPPLCLWSRFFFFSLAPLFYLPFPVLCPFSHVLILSPLFLPLILIFYPPTCLFFITFFLPHHLFLFVDPYPSSPIRDKI